MPMNELVLAAVLATHETGESNPMVGWVFGGIVATAAWVLFSRLQWRNTVLITVAGWAVGLGLLLAL